MKALEELTPENFEYEEWVALQWVRNYLVYEGNPPDDAIAREFEKYYPLKEQVCIFAIFKLMLFFNMLVNTVRRDRYADGAACSITPEASDDRKAKS